VSEEDGPLDAERDSSIELQIARASNHENQSQGDAVGEQSTH